MKKSLILTGLSLVVLSGHLYAGNSDALHPFIPEFARQPYPICTCDCDNKILYQGGRVTSESLEAWAKEAATSAYTFGFGNYETALKKVSQYFTEKGWNEFRTALSESGNLDLLLQNRLIQSAVVAGAPTLTTLGNPGTEDAWKLELPIVVKFENAKTTVEKRYLVTLAVVQTKPHAGLQGLGIAQFIAEPRV